MDDRPGVGAEVAVSVDVGHHVVPQLSLVTFGGLEVDVVDVGPELFDLLRRDRQPQFRLGLGQCDPKPPPGAELPLRTPQRAHLGRGVAGNQRIVVLIRIVGHGLAYGSSFEVFRRFPRCNNALQPFTRRGDGGAAAKEHRRIETLSPAICSSPC